MPETHIRLVTRRPRTRLRVTLPGGAVLDEQQASDTFALALQWLGLPQIEALRIYIRNLPLISDARSDSYASQTEIGGKYVCHHIDNKAKKKLLDKIAKQLSAVIHVEIIPNV